MPPSGVQPKFEATPPFVPFFALAALDAIVAAGAWLPALAGASWPPLVRVALWHPREILFGYISAALSGFFLTALPRWTRRPVPARNVRIILALWLVARLAPLASEPFSFVAALPCIALVISAAVQVAAANDKRNVKTVALLGLYAGAAIFATGSANAATQDFALRLAIAAMIGLVMLIGGRVVPELTSRFDALCGDAPIYERKQAVELFASMSAGIALVLWLALPGGGVLALALTCAAATQAWRMASWLGRRTTSPLRALYSAYASLPAGFALLAAHALAPEKFPESAGLHVWMVGGFGGMTLAIMSSMIRRRTGLAFIASRAGDATALLWLVAVLCRTTAAFVPGPENWLIAAACAWAAAFGLFLFDFRASLLRGKFTR